MALRGPPLDLGDHEHKPLAVVADLEQRRLPLATSRTIAGGSVLAAGFAGGAVGFRQQVDGARGEAVRSSTALLSSGFQPMTISRGHAEGAHAPVL
jgi:hypothetical protein